MWIASFVIKIELTEARARFLEELAGRSPGERPLLVQEHLLESIDVFARGYWDVIPHQHGNESYERLLTLAIVEYVTPLLDHYAASIPETEFRTRATVAIAGRKAWYVSRAQRVRLEAEEADPKLSHLRQSGRM